MRGIRQRRGNARTRQVIVTGQSLGQGLRDFSEALQLYAPGYTVYNTSVGSTPYSGLKRGTYPFERSILEGGSAVLCIHGEGDSIAGAASGVYAGYLAEWAADYSAALRKTVPFLLTQMSSRLYDYGDGFSVGMSRVALDQAAAAQLSGTDNIYLLGPMYQYPYQADQMHLTWDGYSWLGNKAAQVMSRILGGTNWEPLYPTGVSRTGNVITLTLNVPVGPLVADTTTVPARGNYGFNFFNADWNANIADVTLGTNTLTITLTATPTGAWKKLYYAYFSQTGTPLADWPGAPSYAAGGLAAGNIRDSDTAASFAPNTGPYQMGNWLTHFVMDVP